MHPLTYEVMKSIPLLELEQFRHIDDRERLNAIRALAVEQVADDATSESPAERYGRSGRTYRPGTLEDTDQEEGMWEHRTPRQLALEAGLTPLLDSVLTAEQRVLVRLRYDAQESVQQIADRYSTSHVAVVKRLQTVNKKLREALLLAYGPREEAEDE